MLFALTEYLAQFHSGFTVFQYLTLRAILGVVTALAIALLIGPAMIRRLTVGNVGQQVRDDGPESHLSKAGTPTMGGALILVAVAVATLLWSDLTNRFVWIVLLTTLAFGAVGGWDDYLKLRYGNSKGLTARAKILWQTLFALVAAGVIMATAQSPVETSFYLPFFKDFEYHLGWLFIPLVWLVASKKGRKSADKATETAPAVHSATRVVDRPVRSGQQIYARGGDLLVTGAVSAGAELLADGHIHVLGPLRGRALAGVRGLETARIFCRRLDAELLSIAGHYRVAEDIAESERGENRLVTLAGESLKIAEI